MKNLFLTALLAVTLGVSAFASPIKISYVILNNFAADFRTASDVNWSICGQYTKASFLMTKQKMEAFYNPKGELVATSRTIDLDELPTGAKRTFAKKFDGYTVLEAIRFESQEEGAYYVSGENDKENVILKIGDNADLSIFKRTRK